MALQVQVAQVVLEDKVDQAAQAAQAKLEEIMMEPQAIIQILRLQNYSGCLPVSTMCTLM